MSMEYIRKTYGVPAKRGATVLFRKCMHEEPIKGTIIGSKGEYLRIKFVGNLGIYYIHPTWMIEYL